MILQKQFIARIYIVVLFFVIFIFFVYNHLHQLQVKRHDNLYAQAKQVYKKNHEHISKRGSILDRNGTLLATDQNGYKIYALPQDLNDEQKSILNTLTTYFTPEQNNIKRRLFSDKKEVVLIKYLSLEKFKDFKEKYLNKLYKLNVAKIKTNQPHLNNQEAEQIAKKVLQKAHLKGLRIQATTKRFYPQGELASYIVGFLNEYNKGVIGIENSQNEHLKKNSIYFSHETPFQNEFKKAENGKDITLTIDANIQTIVEEELQRVIDKHPCKRIYIAMARPTTGEVLALAQWPNFNPNDRSTITGDILKNNILTSVFEPGSTFKPITIAAALDYDLLKINDEIFCENGTFFHGGKTLQDAGHSYGDLSLAKILQKSSNIGCAKIAINYLQKDRLHEAFIRFGIGQKTNIELQQSKGIYRHKDKWDGLSISRFPMGQGISVTIAQMLQVYCTFANNGILMPLHLIKKIDDELIDYSWQATRIIKDKTAKDITYALSLVTQEGGTARKAKIKGLMVSGKTGTSQKWINKTEEKKGHYSTTKHIGSFMGYVPSLKPKFVLCVVIDEAPKGLHYGGALAAPTFKKIAERTLKYLRLNNE